MKCIVRYEIDGIHDFFVIEDKDVDKCHRAVLDEIERLGLDAGRNKISIDVKFENKRSAWFYGIPCWYYVDTKYLEGRNLFYGFLLFCVHVVIALLSWISEHITGKPFKYHIKVREIE